MSLVKLSKRSSLPLNNLTLHSRLRPAKPPNIAGGEKSAPPSQPLFYNQDPSAQERGFPFVAVYDSTELPFFSAPSDEMSLVSSYEAVLAQSEEMAAQDFSLQHIPIEAIECEETIQRPAKWVKVAI